MGAPSFVALTVMRHGRGLGAELRTARALEKHLSQLLKFGHEAGVCEAEVLLVFTLVKWGQEDTGGRAPGSCMHQLQPSAPIPEKCRLQDRHVHPLEKSPVSTWGSTGGSPVSLSPRQIQEPPNCTILSLSSLPPTSFLFEPPPVPPPPPRGRLRVDSHLLSQASGLPILCTPRMGPSSSVTKVYSEGHGGCPGSGCSVKGEKQASPTFAVPLPGRPPPGTPHLLPVEATDGLSRLAEGLLSLAEFPCRDQVVPAGHALEDHQALLHQVGHCAVLLRRAGSTDWQHPRGGAEGLEDALDRWPLGASLSGARCRGGGQGLECGPAAGHSPGHYQLQKLHILWDPGSVYGITDVSIATKRVIHLNFL